MKEKEINDYLIQDQYGQERVMAQTIEGAIAAFYEYRKAHGEDNPRITQIHARLGESVIFTEE